MKRYRATQRLVYMTDKAQIARVQKGERIPLKERKVAVAMPGEVVSDIPAASLPWLLEQGAIEAVPAKPEEDA